MTILLKVARAIAEARAEKYRTKHGNAVPKNEVARQTSKYLSEATAAITAFLAAAAEEGWHMRPDEATEEMTEAGWDADTRLNTDPMKAVYHAMLAAAPEFEDK
jgi:hypothetical protein